TTVVPTAAAPVFYCCHRAWRHFLWQPERAVVLRGSAVVPVARVWGSVLEDVEPAGGSLRGFCGGDICCSVRIIRGAEAGAPAGFAGGAHDFYWRTAAEIARGTGAAADRAGAFAGHRAGNRRGPDGRVADYGAVLVRPRNRRNSRSGFRQAGYIFFFL